MQQLADNFATLSQKPKILLELDLALLEVLLPLLVNPPVVLLVQVPKDEPNRPEPHLYLLPVKYLLRPPTNTFKV